MWPVSYVFLFAFCSLGAQISSGNLPIAWAAGGLAVQGSNVFTDEFKKYILYTISTPTNTTKWDRKVVRRVRLPLTHFLLLLQPLLLLPILRKVDRFEGGEVQMGTWGLGLGVGSWEGQIRDQTSRRLTHSLNLGARCHSKRNPRDYD